MADELGRPASTAPTKARCACRQPGPDLAHALRAPPGRAAASARHRRRVPRYPRRGQARLRAAPLGDAGRSGRWIGDAGGVAVVAHPARYELGDRGMHALLREFTSAGGRGVEVVTGNHTRRGQPFAGSAQEFGPARLARQRFPRAGRSRERRARRRCRRCRRALTPVWHRFSSPNPPAADARLPSIGAWHSSSRFTRGSAAAPDTRGGADPPARRRRRHPDRLVLRAGLPYRRQGRDGAHPRRSATWTNAITSRWCAATCPSSRPFAKVDNRQYRLLKPHARAVHASSSRRRGGAAAPVASARHHRRAHPGPSGPAGAARRARRAAAVFDADPARRRLPLNDADEIRARLEHSVDLVIDAGPAASSRPRWSTSPATRRSLMREGKGDHRRAWSVGGPQRCTDRLPSPWTASFRRSRSTRCR